MPAPEKSRDSTFLNELLFFLKNSTYIFCLVQLTKKADPTKILKMLKMSHLDTIKPAVLLNIKDQLRTLRSIIILARPIISFRRNLKVLWISANTAKMVGILKNWKTFRTESNQFSGSVTDDHMCLSVKNISLCLSSWTSPVTLFRNWHFLWKHWSAKIFSMIANNCLDLWKIINTFLADIQHLCVGF